MCVDSSDIYEIRAGIKSARYEFAAHTACYEPCFREKGK
jgi:hypothetical protein